MISCGPSIIFQTAVRAFVPPPSPQVYYTPHLNVVVLRGDMRRAGTVLGREFDVGAELPKHAQAVAVVVLRRHVRRREPVVVLAAAGDTEGD